MTGGEAAGLDAYFAFQVALGRAVESVDHD